MSATSCGFSARRDASQAARSRSSISIARSRYGLTSSHRSWLSSGMAPTPRSSESLRPDRAMEIDPRLLPVTLHRALRHAPHPSNLREGEAAEEFQIDDLRERSVDRSKLVESCADL